MMNGLAVPNAKVEMEVIDGRVWPTTYTLNRLRQDLALKLAPMVLSFSLSHVR
jgi:hypothetical protein